MPKNKYEIANRITSKILEDLTDRKGFRQVWDDIDEDIQEEIMDAWIRIALDQMEEKET